MEFASVNWWVVLGCVLFSMLSGSVWFNPKTFFPVWWAVVGKPDQEPGAGMSMALLWFLTVLSAVVQGIFFCIIVTALAPHMAGGQTWLTGAEIGFILWLGFIAPTYLVNRLFAGHGFKVWAIETGNHLLNFVVFGAMAGFWS